MSFYTDIEQQAKVTAAADPDECPADLGYRYPPGAFYFRAACRVGDTIMRSKHTRRCWRTAVREAQRMSEATGAPVVECRPRAPARRGRPMTRGSVSIQGRAVACAQARSGVSFTGDLGPGMLVTLEQDLAKRRGK